MELLLLNPKLKHLRRAVEDCRAWANTGNPARCAPAITITALDFSLAAWKAKSGGFGVAFGHGVPDPATSVVGVAVCRVDGHLRVARVAGSRVPAPASHDGFLDALPFGLGLDHRLWHWLPVEELVLGSPLLTGPRLCLGKVPEHRLSRLTNAVVALDRSGHHANPVRALRTDLRMARAQNRCVRRVHFL